MAAVVPGADLTPTRPRGVATRSTRAIGALAAVLFAWVLVGGLRFTPAEEQQGESVRIMYVHVPSAWVAYLAFVVTAVASACYLLGRRRSLGFDRVAGASAEVGVLFMALALVSGSLWGRPTWGTFWVWDPRLTTTAFLFVTYVGYLAVRGTGANGKASWSGGSAARRITRGGDARRPSRGRGRRRFRPRPRPPLRVRRPWR